tara:strand:+ start:86 stop:493 length:408 start_codon:yes stop_codon:yes gene_type:complete
MSEGRKFDSEKPKLYLLPPKSIIEIGKVLTYGAEKYDAENWRKVDDLQNRYTSAALRHIFAHIDGEKLDEETGLSHLAHAMCCLLFKLEDELLGESEEKRTRETDAGKHSTCYESSVRGTPDNKKGSMRDFEYLV